MATIEEILANGISLLKSGEHTKAKEAFKASMDAPLNEKNYELLGKLIEGIAKAYDDSIDTAEPLASQHYFNLESIREIFPKDFTTSDAFIARALYNTQYVSSNDSDTNVILKCLDYLNEAITILNKYPANTFPALTDPIVKQIGLTCNKLNDVALTLKNPTEQLEIYNKIIDGMKNAFPEGHHNIPVYITNKGIFEISSNKIGAGVTSLYESLKFTNGTSSVANYDITQICKYSLAQINNPDLDIQSKQSYVILSSLLPDANPATLQCEANLKYALAKEYTKLAVTEFFELLPMVVEDNKLDLQTRIDSTCNILGYTNSTDCQTAIMGVAIDSTTNGTSST